MKDTALHRSLLCNRHHHTKRAG